jgi:hypothetical protein
MELAFSIDRDGLVEDTHARVYKQLGAWVRGCYGSPLATTSGHGGSFTLSLPAGAAFDRFQLQEETVQGQRVRRYAIEASADGGGSWRGVAGGFAIGTKVRKPPCWPRSWPNSSLL